MAHTAKVVYKPDTQTTDEYIVIVNPETVRLIFAVRSFTDIPQLKKWKDGG